LAKDLSSWQRAVVNGASDLVLLTEALVPIAEALFLSAEALFLLAEDL
jgi:hypothetical protein